MVMSSCKRARTAGAVIARASDAGKKPLRPTDEEERCAARILKLCKDAKLEPPLVAPSARPEARVIALGLAMYFGEEFASSAKAKMDFGVGPSTDVRKLWAEDKLLSPPVRALPLCTRGCSESLSPDPRNDS